MQPQRRVTTKEQLLDVVFPKVSKEGLFGTIPSEIRREIDLFNYEVTYDLKVTLIREEGYQPASLYKIEIMNQSSTISLYLQPMSIEFYSNRGIHHGASAITQFFLYMVYLRGKKPEEWPKRTKFLLLVEDKAEVYIPSLGGWTKPSKRLEIESGDTLAFHLSTFKISVKLVEALYNIANLTKSYVERM